MATLNELLARWATLGPPAEDGAAQFSVVLGGGTTIDTFRERLEAAAPGHDPETTPAFLGALAAETGGRFWILTFPDLDAQRGETLAFEVARALTQELGLDSCRPVLVDSLIGQAMVDPALAGAAGLAGFFTCSGDNMGPEARGWAPRALGVQAAWAHEPTRGAGVTIASIDTGYSDHVELQGVISGKPQLNLVENNTDARDRFSTNVPLSNPGHGTLVASVAASRGDIDADGNTTGPGEITGAAPGAEILPIRAIRSVVDLRQSRIPAAIEHAIAQDCDVIVMALGSPFPIEPVEVALRAAVRRGIVVVCAAGNCVGLVVFPARFAPLGLSTAVAAVDYLKAPWERTSKGDSVTVSAFGEAVWGARKRNQASPNDAVARSEGTTLATSLTAGVAALWVARHGRDALRAHAAAAGTTVQAMFNRLIAGSASKPSGGWPKGMGAGLVNAGELLSRPLPAPGALLADVPLADAHVTPLKRFLGPTAAEIDGLAGLEATGLDEGLAAETLWRLYRGSARDRTAAIAGQDVVGAMDGAQLAGFNGPPPSQDLDAALAGKPRLRALTQ